jgi:DNA-binding MarR family transcriptional regulator
MSERPAVMSDYQLWTIFRNVSHLITIAQNRELSKRSTRVTIRQVSMLYVINLLGDEATPAMIARRQARAPTTISNILIRMEKQGLIKRSENPRWKNRIVLRLTKKGKNILDTVNHRESLQRIMSVLTAEQLHQLREILLPLRESAIRELDTNDTSSL